MSNMSYCRFRNTRNDFADCKDALQGIIDGVDGDGEAPEPLSRDELEAAQLLIADALELVDALLGAVGGASDDPNILGQLCGFLETRNKELKE